LEFLLSGLVVFFVILAETLKKTKLLDPVFARKILHIGAISISAISVYVINIKTLILIIGVALPLLLVAVLLGFFKEEKTGRKSFGILYFAVAFFFLAFFFGDNRPHLVFYSLMVLAWSDGLATVIGYGMGRRVLAFSKEAKTWEGSVTFFITSFVLMYSFQFVEVLDLPSISLDQAVFISSFLTGVEMLSTRSFDNLWVPAGMTYWLLLDFSAFDIWYAILIPILAFLAFKKKTLTIDGALAASLLGWIFLLNPAPSVFIFPAVFFLIGSLLSKLPGHQDVGSTRDSSQVFANGLIPAMCFMAYFIVDDSVFLLSGAAGFAFALSDTSSSEIGVRMGGKHIQILTLRRANPGESGAITLSGSIAGIIFSLVTASALFLFPTEASWFSVFLVALSGIAGNIADSIIGARFQAKYQTEAGELVERSVSSSDRLLQGHPIMDNSMTNLLSSFITCVMALLLSSILQ
jgi:uncharacterized protein (TIGR00297 family)